jgi:hypothetical protein
MRNKIIFILVTVLFCAFNVNYAAVSDDESNDSVELDKVLLKSSQYCSILAHAVLDFICKEKVTIDFFNAGRGWKEQQKYRTQEWVYDYQLIGKGLELNEQRILLEKDRKKVSEEPDVIERVFPHSLLILGPIGLLSEYWQEHHDYMIKKRGRLFGEKIYVIEALPKPGCATEHLWGKAWISQDDFSILKIEWNQESAEGYESLVKEAEEQNLKPDFTLIAEYKYEKNGIRFPSKFVLIENYRHPLYNIIRNSKKTVMYYDYKFFTVKTDVVFK